ncbi:hypothetical protein [Streptosporangium sp. NPDC049376]|uniref:hypothetical protein n=1 Tax=Streptosporangium sp. NPDC049376 TaxID=3366192 RepID=UPI00379B78D7
MIRIRRVPFLRSRPSLLLPLSPLARPPGFTAPPPAFFLTLAGMVVAYLVLVEPAKEVFSAFSEGGWPAVRRRGHAHHVQRRASRFSHTGPLSGGTARP